MLSRLYKNTSRAEKLERKQTSAGYHDEPPKKRLKTPKPQRAILVRMTPKVQRATSISRSSRWPVPSIKRPE